MRRRDREPSVAIGVLALVALGATLFLGAVGVGPLPPLGPVLGPARGAWALARSAELPRDAVARVPGLGDSVLVLYDDRDVPHVFARSTTDAARALGYVTARDRLFQLELQTRATAGTLTEWLGRRPLVRDRDARQLGLAWSAEREYRALPADGGYRRVLDAYADGINAWIAEMRPSELPLEYRLLGARPARWEPQYGLYLFRRMDYTLTYDPWDLRRQRIVALIGAKATDALFPVHSPIEEPIEPAAGTFPRFDSAPLPPPEMRRTGGQADGRTGDPSIGRSAGPPVRRSAEFPLRLSARPPDRLGGADVVGSNNWSVAPARSADHHALLEGDPHLELTLPSIWYEAQLVVDDSIDMYGVTIPGSAWMILGFTRDVAWSFTNTGADVLDYYAETLDDSTHPTRYRLDGTWRPLESRVESYRDARGRVLAVDTIYHTHRGPIVWRDGRPYSMRWVALEPSGTGTAILDVTRAGSVAEFMQAMAGFGVPAQNMIAADRSGTIGIRSTGRFPIRPGDGRGDRIFDGTTSASDWIGSWPTAALPGAVNPARGFLSSNNQDPLAATARRGYLGSHWPAPWRAMRINELLRADSAVTPDAMRRFQTDPGNVRADLFVPPFLAAAARAEARGRADSTLRRAAALLGEWDRRYTLENNRAALFELAMNLLRDRVWDELLPSDSTGRLASRRIATPGEDVLWRLMQDPTSAWWDDRRTPDVVEDRDAILTSALSAALDSAVAAWGDPSSAAWRWDRRRHANVMHPFGFPSLSALNIPIQGGDGTLNPSSGSGAFGASWRMVVDMGDTVSAWVTYPGGQSGNPVSRRYDDRIAEWSAGRLEPVLHPHTATALPPDRIRARLVLRPAR